MALSALSVLSWGDAGVCRIVSISLVPVSLRNLLNKLSTNESKRGHYPRCPRIEHLRAFIYSLHSAKPADEVCDSLLRRYLTVVAAVTVGARSRQAYARRKIPIPDRCVFAAARELLAVGTEAHGPHNARVLPQGGPEGVPRCCIIEPDRACLTEVTVAGCDEAAIRRESYRIDLLLAPQGRLAHEGAS